METSSEEKLEQVHSHYELACPSKKEKNSKESIHGGGGRVHRTVENYTSRFRDKVISGQPSGRTLRT